MLDLGWKIALIIGLFQAVALIPGVSRSGITMTAALFCGLNRVDASRFSFLLSIPVTAGAVVFLMADLLAEANVNWAELAYGAVVSGLFAYCCIHYFLSIIGRMGFMPFVIYRILLGIGLWIWIV